MTGPVRRILIIGGGSSGWMAATLLSQLPDVEVTLIEASDIPIIGVGESTNTVAKHFHRIVGVDEKAFLRGSNGAFKIAIRFESFNRLGGVFFHPFGAPPDRARGLFRPDAQAHYATWRLAQAQNRFSRQLSYAYQLDAGLYGEYLKQRCKRQPQRVRHVLDRVLGAELSQSGEIARIQTAQSGALTADLYVDCSGFRALLLDKTLHEPFQSVGRQLFNDRAIAARVPYQDQASELKSYTNCVGLSSGWVWEIPLWSRLGTGYVYSSAFLSPSQAEAEYREYLGVERVKDLQFNHIEIRAGRHERAWIGNCVGIGVSFGFLEPLESTGLSLTQTAIMDLAQTLSTLGATSASRDGFNQRQRETFDTTRDFVTAHFALTTREDTPYWRAVRHETEIPDSLRNVLEQAAHKSYAPIEQLANTFYGKFNWNLILSGMGLFSEEAPSGADVAPPESDVLAHVLRERVYDGEYQEPLVQRPSEHDLAHPMWAPTW